MKKILQILTSIVLLNNICFSQINYFRNKLNFDTSFYINTGINPKRGQSELHFFPTNNSIYLVGCNKNTNNNFRFYLLNNEYLTTKTFELKNTFNESGFRDLDIHKNIYAILSYSGWHIYKLDEKDTMLIKRKTISISKKNIRNQFTYVKIINDSIVSFARDYRYLQIDTKECVSVMYYDFINDKEIKSFYINTEVPELGFFSPNHRITYFGASCYVADFSNYKVYEVNMAYDNPKLIINDVNSYAKMKLDTNLLHIARLKSIIENNVGPIMTFLEPYFMDSIFVLSDVHILNDSTLLCRTIKPQIDTIASSLNNYIDVWVKNKEDKFVLKQSLHDNGNYRWSDSLYTKENYTNSTLFNRFIIKNNKMYSIRWGSPYYPIGLGKKYFFNTENMYLSKNELVPTLNIYEFKNTFFKY